MKSLLTGLKPQAFSIASRAYAGLRAGPSPRPGLRVLMYHAIGTQIEGDTRGLYNMPLRQFEAHMRHLAAQWRTVLSPLDLPALGNGGFRVALTFDDGYLDNLTVAAPILSELGIPFTVFVCAGAVRDGLSGFLRPDDVRALARIPGVTIGSHSVTHARLTRCSDDELKRELQDSKAYLEDLTGRPVDCLSYPHGDVDLRVREAAALAGYRIGATSRFDVNAPSRDPLLLCRTDVWAEDGPAVLEQKLRGDWDWNRWRSPDPARGA